AVVKNADVVGSAPDDHLTASPHCRVIVSGFGRGGGAGGCPTIYAGIVSSAGVQKAAPDSAPDDHFPASPVCRSIAPSIWWVAGAGGCPSIVGAPIRPVRYSRKRIVSTPLDH